MKLVLGLMTMISISACSIRNSGIRKQTLLEPCVDSKITSSNLQSWSLSTNYPKWIGGAFSYKWKKYEDSLENPPEFNWECSGIFEFSKTTESYNVSITSNSGCVEFFNSAKDGDLYIFEPEQPLSGSGYLRFRVTNPRLEKIMQVMNDTPYAPNVDNPRSSIIDIIDRPYLNPRIQTDISIFLPERKMEAETYYCGTSDFLPNDLPRPANCIWPHGIQTRTFPVSPVEGVTSTRDLDFLVRRTTALALQRNSEQNPEFKAVYDYQNGLVGFDKLANEYRLLVWLARVLSNVVPGVDNGIECNKTKENRIACARMITKHFLPQYKDLVESAILQNFPDSISDSFRAELGSGKKAEYTAALALRMDRWKEVVELMKSNKGMLSIAANLPTKESRPEFRLAKLFPSAGEEDSSLAGVLWKMNDTFLSVDFTNTQSVLRRNADTGSVIFFGDVPILSLLPTAAHEDAGTLMPLPLPEPKPSSQPKCK